MLEALWGSVHKNAVVLPDNLGPGPQTLLAGDASAGWFGEVAATLLITYTDLMAAHTPTQGSAQWTGPWLKFILDGKILFVAKYTAWKNCPWPVLNTLGVVSGKQIVIGANTYRHRMLKSDIVDPSTIAAGPVYLPGNNASLDKSEWGRLMFPVIDTTAGGKGSWAQYTKAQLLWNAADTAGVVTIVKERAAGSTTHFLCMGGFNGAGWRYQAAANSAAWMGHRPVLELL